MAIILMGSDIVFGNVLSRSFLSSNPSTLEVAGCREE